MKRYVVVVAAVTLPIVATALIFALLGGPDGATSAGDVPRVAVTTTSLLSKATTSAVAAAPVPSSPTLEDGRHFGFIKRVDFGTSTVIFDLAYLLNGEKANQAAAARGYETPVANDYFIVNDNPKLRRLRLAPDVQILLLDWSRCCSTFFSADRERFQASFRNKHFTSGNYQGKYGSYWLTVQDGAVVKIQNRFQP
jgi:hypothetical protein